MNQFSAFATNESLSAHHPQSHLNPMFANGGSVSDYTHAQSHYGRYQSCSANVNYGPQSNSANGNTSVPYGNVPPPSSSSSSAAYNAHPHQYMTPAGDYPSTPVNHYPSTTTAASPNMHQSVDYFARTTRTSVDYANLFAKRKCSVDCNNNNNNIPNRSSLDSSDVKREELDDSKAEHSPTGQNDDPLEPTESMTDDDYDEDDDDEDSVVATNMRTPIYVSPNCILYSYIGVDTLGAINDHFQKSFAMLFQNMRSTTSGTNAVANGSEWTARDTSGDESNEVARSKLWSTHSYYKDVYQHQNQQQQHEQQSQSHQLVSTAQSLSTDNGEVDKAKVGNGDDSAPPKQCHRSSSSASTSPVDKSKSLSPGTLCSSVGTNASSRSCSRSSLVVVVANGNQSTPHSPNDAVTAVATECKSVSDDNTSNALVPAGSADYSTHQSLRSAQYHRRYERRKRRYLKRFQLMHIPMIRRRLPASFWKFSARFSCYYATNGTGGTYPMTSYTGNGNGYGQLCASRSGQSQFGATVPYNHHHHHHHHQSGQSYRDLCGSTTSGYFSSGLTVDTGDSGQSQSEQQVQSSSSYDHDQQYQSQSNASLTTCPPLSSQSQPYHRAPLSLSVSMTIGGGLGASGQTPTTASTTLATSLMTSPSTTTSAATCTASSPATHTSHHTSSTSAAAAAAAAALATLNNDLTLDISMHISPAIALSAGAASATPTTPNSYRAGVAVESNVATPSALYPHHPHHHHHHHQNAHTSSYLGLLQSSLQHSASAESYHYYQYSSKLTATTGGTQSTTGQQGQASIGLPASNYSYSNGTPKAVNSASYYSPAANSAAAPHHYPSSFSHMMMAHHRSTTGTYPETSVPNAEATLTSSEPMYGGVDASPSLAYVHPHVQSHHHYQSTAESSPFIAVAAAVRTYQDVTNGQSVRSTPS